MDFVEASVQYSLLETQSQAKPSVEIQSELGGGGYA